jgi:tRNAThr (cytosine32-N3)-methyltransferase
VDSDVWSQNAWDHVEPPAERLEYVEEALKRQRAVPVPPEEQGKYNDRPCRHWDNFYKTNTSNFFKNRKWLHLEFPELLEATQEASGKVRVLEVGCGMYTLSLSTSSSCSSFLGAGNTAYPIIESNKNPELELIACDYSHRAVTLVKVRNHRLKHPETYTLTVKSPLRF